jgi:uncharacterized membrane protein YccC
MSVGGRTQTRQRMLRRAGVIVAVLALLAVLFLFSGHWVLGVILGLAAAVGIWVFLQVRTVR